MLSEWNKMFPMNRSSQSSGSHPAGNSTPGDVSHTIQPWCVDGSLTSKWPDTDYLQVRAEFHRTHQPQELFNINESHHRLDQSDQVSVSEQNLHMSMRKFHSMHTNNTVDYTKSSYSIHPSGSSPRFDRHAFQDDLVQDHERTGVLSRNLEVQHHIPSSQFQSTSPNFGVFDVGNQIHRSQQSQHTVNSSMQNVRNSVHGVREFFDIHGTTSELARMNVNVAALKMAQAEDYRPFQGQRPEKFSDAQFPAHLHHTNQLLYSKPGEKTPQNNSVITNDSTHSKYSTSQQSDEDTNPLTSQRHPFLHPHINNQIDHKYKIPTDALQRDVSEITISCALNIPPIHFGLVVTQLKKYRWSSRFNITLTVPRKGSPPGSVVFIAGRTDSVHNCIREMANVLGMSVGVTEQSVFSADSLLCSKQDVHQNGHHNVQQRGHLLGKRTSRHNSSSSLSPSAISALLPSPTSPQMGLNIPAKLYGLTFTQLRERHWAARFGVIVAVPRKGSSTGSAVTISGPPFAVENCMAEMSQVLQMHVRFTSSQADGRQHTPESISVSGDTRTIPDRGLIDKFDPISAHAHPLVSTTASAARQFPEILGKNLSGVSTGKMVDSSDSNRFVDGTNPTHVSIYIFHDGATCSLGASRNVGAKKVYNAVCDAVQRMIARNDRFEPIQPKIFWKLYLPYGNTDSAIPHPPDQLLVHFRAHGVEIVHVDAREGGIRTRMLSDITECKNELVVDSNSSEHLKSGFELSSQIPDGQQWRIQHTMSDSGSESGFGMIKECSRPLTTSYMVLLTGDNAFTQIVRDSFKSGLRSVLIHAHGDQVGTLKQACMDDFGGWKEILATASTPEIDEGNESPSSITSGPSSPKPLDANNEILSAGPAHQISYLARPLDIPCSMYGRLVGVQGAQYKYLQALYPSVELVVPKPETAASAAVTISGPVKDVELCMKEISRLLELPIGFTDSGGGKKVFEEKIKITLQRGLYVERFLLNTFHALSESVYVRREGPNVVVRASTQDELRHVSTKISNELNQLVEVHLRVSIGSVVLRGQGMDRGLKRLCETLHVHVHVFSRKGKGSTNNGHGRAGCAQRGTFKSNGSSDNCVPGEWTGNLDTVGRSTTLHPPGTKSVNTEMAVIGLKQTHVDRVVAYIQDLKNNVGQARKPWQHYLQQLSLTVVDTGSTQNDMVSAADTEKDCNDVQPEVRPTDFLFAAPMNESLPSLQYSHEQSSNVNAFSFHSTSEHEFFPTHLRRPSTAPFQDVAGSRR